MILTASHFYLIHNYYKNYNSNAMLKVYTPGCYPDLDKNSPGCNVSIGSLKNEVHKLLKLYLTILSECYQLNGVYLL